MRVSGSGRYIFSCRAFGTLHTGPARPPWMEAGAAPSLTGCLTLSLGVLVNEEHNPTPKGGRWGENERYRVFWSRPHMGPPTPLPPPLEAPGDPRQREEEVGDTPSKPPPLPPESKESQQEWGSTSYLLLGRAEARGPDWGMGYPSPTSPVLWEGPQGQARAQLLEARHVC